MGAKATHQTIVDYYRKVNKIGRSLEQAVEYISELEKTVSQKEDEIDQKDWELSNFLKKLAAASSWAVTAVDFIPDNIYQYFSKLESKKEPELDDFEELIDHLYWLNQETRTLSNERERLKERLLLNQKKTVITLNKVGG